MDKPNNFVAKLVLSDYLNSRVIEVENDDNIKEKGIFIPIDINNLFLGPKNSVLGWMFVTEKYHESLDGMTHYMKMKTDRTHVEKLRSLGYEPPYLGGMRPTKMKTQYQNNKKRKGLERVKKINYE